MTIFSLDSDCDYDDGKVSTGNDTYLECAEYMSQNGYTECDDQVISQLCCKTCHQRNDNMKRKLHFLCLTMLIKISNTVHYNLSSLLLSIYKTLILCMFVPNRLENHLMKLDILLHTISLGF